MSKNKALITGIAGFTGYHLFEHMQEVDPELVIVGIDRSAPTFAGNYEFIQLDLLNCAGVLNSIRQVKPSYIFHLAGLSFSDDPKLFYEINVIGTMNLLEAVGRTRDQIDPRVLIVSSSAEYGIVNEDELPISEKNPLRPISHYGISKVAQDLLGWQYFMARGLKVIRARPFNLIGPGQSADFVCGALARQIVEVEKGTREPEILVGNLDPERDFSDVRDVVRAYWQLMREGSYGEIYNIGSGRSYSIREVLEILLREASVEMVVKQDQKKIRQLDIPRQIGDIDKIRNEIGWSPKITLEKSLRDMLNYFRTVL
ncbi:GDP-mannose 4,6-dehydratase [Candidatus Bipolaricaulota bacterium]